MDHLPWLHEPGFLSPFVKDPQIPMDFHFSHSEQDMRINHRAQTALDKCYFRWQERHCMFERLTLPTTHSNKQKKNTWILKNSTSGTRLIYLLEMQEPVLLKKNTPSPPSLKGRIQNCPPSLLSETGQFQKLHHSIICLHEQISIKSCTSRTSRSRTRLTERQPGPPLTF